MNTSQQDLWRKFCHIMDGMAIASTVFALRRENVLQQLASSPSPTDITLLAQGKKYSPGFFHLAFRLFEDQGFLVRSAAGNGMIHAALTPAGRAWLPLTTAYDSAIRFLDSAIGLDKRAADGAPDNSLQGFMDLSGLEQRVRLHQAAPLLAAFLVHLYDRGLLASDNHCLAMGDMEISPRLAEACLDMLQNLGWITPNGQESWSFTAEGKLLPSFTPQLFYPVSYLNTFRRVPDLIFPGPNKEEKLQAGVESHIDRGLDIRFSGLVYQRNFREPVSRILQSIFNRGPLASQPRYILDTGSGDGTALLDMYRTVQEETVRGKHLDAFPLTMIGIEYNRMAQESTARKLQEHEIPHHTFPGDISEPEQLETALRAHLINPDQVLHFSKSVIHNRIFSRPKTTEDLGEWADQSTGVFIDTDGRLISSRELAANLVEHFRRWGPLARSQGMIVIEAHCVPPGMVAGSSVPNMLTCLDATHGYSRQYLVEKDFFHSSITTAGYNIETVMERCLPGVSAPVLTVDFLMP